MREAIDRWPQSQCENFRPPSAGGFGWFLCPVLNNKATKLKSLSKILRRVAYPVEPFGLKFVQDCLPLSLLDGIRDGFGKQAGLFDQLGEGHANELQYVHRPICRHK